MEMEIIVEKGLGYETVEQREKQKLEIGTIAIDSSFSPVLNVGYNIENVRVGKMTNYEKVTFDILTDGTIDADTAIKAAATILKDHFDVWSNIANIENEEEVAEDEDEEADSEDDNEEEVETEDEE